MFRQLRRADRASYDAEVIDQIMRTAQSITIAMHGKEGAPYPYAVTVSFGWDGSHVYIHGAHEGLKHELLAADPHVCFSAHVPLGVVGGDRPQDWSFAYHSVTGFGTVVELTSDEEKLAGLNVLMDHYGGPHVPPQAAPHVLPSVWCARIDVEHISAKRRERA